MITREQLLDCAGRDRFVSPSHVVDQKKIDAFADLSGDRAFLHVDPDLAKQTSFGGTVAHGMLVLSMMSGMAFEVVPQVERAVTSISCGFRDVRFLLPVPVGAKIWGAFQFDAAKARGRKDVMVLLGCTVHVEGVDRPALTADWDLLYRF